MIRLYQRYAPARLRSACRFEPSCSNFAATAIVRWGFWRGWRLSLQHLFACRPPHGGPWAVPVSDDELQRFGERGPPVRMLRAAELPEWMETRSELPKLGDARPHAPAPVGAEPPAITSP
uniref:Membrane protein insertion efficiency factor n=1 Tax=Nannocystis exedens TaxID=54 RepID=A0A3S5GYP9_9BACT|nr:hypothetical protein [Nannocystis exedens]